jgi:hypothetical protein
MKIDNRLIIELCIGSLIGAALTSSLEVLTIFNTICIILLVKNSVEKEEK